MNREQIWRQRHEREERAKQREERAKREQELWARHSAQVDAARN